MSPKVPRLKRRAEFLKVARDGRKWAAPGVVLQDLERDGDGDYRAGFTVSRKVGNAVQRNRARRRLKAAAEAVLPVEARAGHDYVLIGRAATLTRPFADLIADIRKALDRTGRDQRRQEQRQVQQAAPQRPPARGGKV